MQRRWEPGGWGGAVGGAWGGPLRNVSTHPVVCYQEGPTHTPTAQLTQMPEESVHDKFWRVISNARARDLFCRKPVVERKQIGRPLREPAPPVRSPIPALGRPTGWAEHRWAPRAAVNEPRRQFQTDRRRTEIPKSSFSD